MTTLTPNRLLQKGDEYRDNGHDSKNPQWKPVPKDDFGLQVMFTKYAEVRRPSEKEAKPISPDSDSASTTPKVEKAVPAKAESEKTPVPTHSGTGDASYLPTVVSNKAHKHGETTDPTKAPLPPTYDHKGNAPFPKATAADTKRAKEAFEMLRKIARELEAKAAATPKPLSTEIPFSPAAPECIWIGRNGTFKQKGVNLYAHNDGNVIKVVPTGARGVAKNAQIEFPKSAIPQIIGFLQKQL